MPGLKFNQFGGMLPRANPRSRSGQVADLALDVNLDQGTLSPWRERKLVLAGVTPILAMKRFDCCWLKSEKCVSFVHPWPSCVFAVRAGDGPPVYANFENACAGEWCFLGVPCPTEAPVASPTDPPAGAYPPTDFRKDFEQRHYRYAWVNQYGHEGPGSAPSGFVNTFEGAPVHVWLPSPPPGYCITWLRLYRSGTPLESGGESSNPPNTEWFHVTDIAVGTNYFLDGVLTLDLGLGQHVNSTFHGDERLPAPYDLECVVTCENGMMAGIEPSTGMICFSEPFLPTSWPMRYRKTLWPDDRPVALAATGQMLYVLTTSHPYTIEVPQQQLDGRHGVFRHRESLPCLSKRSVASGSGACYYASLDGLVAVSGTQSRVISEQLLSKRQWAAWRPNRMIGAVYDGHYFGFSETSDLALQEAGVHGFRMRTGEAEHIDADQVTLTYLTDNPTAVWVDDHGSLFLAEDGDISQWNAGNTLRPYLWRNTEFAWARRTSLAAGYVLTEAAGQVSVTVRTDRGDYTQNVLNGDLFRLPNWMSVVETQIEFRGTGEVTEAVFGSSWQETHKAGGNV